MAIFHNGANGANRTPHFAFTAQLDASVSTLTYNFPFQLQLDPGR
jgi:hypothetical protein